MTHAIIRNDTEVLSRVEPRGPLVWLDYGVSLATEWRYAITFDRREAARKCAGMHGAEVHTIGDYDAAA